MATTYNQIGSLTELLSKLGERKIDDFQTLEDIRLFRRNYQGSLELIKQKNKERLLQDISRLESEYAKFSLELDRATKERRQLLEKEKVDIFQKIAYLKKTNNPITEFISWFKRKKLLNRMSVLELNFEEEVKKPFRHEIKVIEALKKEHEDKSNNTEKWIDSLSEAEIDRMKFVLSVLDENKNLFYGAEGEERAFSELSRLPDSYFVINDYRREFYRPIYDKRNDDRIHSIQIDHIVVGPTGIHIVETKNWSQASVENLDLFSPVKQLRRSSFAMFVLLNQAVENGELNVFNISWGGQKISPKNIILLMNHKPSEEFQYVKILSLNEINRHIIYGNKVFSNTEVDALVKYLRAEE
ncbi:MAG: nuclease-related domain-containing protein [Patescibacteria group bacterium]|nr:nuclease-related domain-containing protein [Patescibacteria group bacterium]